jgi:hypothetical protein
MNFVKKIVIFIFVAWMGTVLAMAAERERPAGLREEKAVLEPLIGDKFVIAAEPNTTYIEKMAVEFHPSGALYVMFKAQNNETKKHYVDLYKYDGLRSSFVKHISETDLRAYECDMDITSDGYIHCVWVEAANPNAPTHYIRYRYFDGINWSPVQTLRTLQIDGEASGHNLEKVDDIRLSVDNDGNLFVAYMIWPAGRCQTFSRFGTTIYLDPFPFVGRSKHVAVAADDKYVHIGWMGMEGNYGIYYARRNKVPNAPWTTVIKVIEPLLAPPDRPFIGVGSDQIPQMLYLKGLEGGGREIHHRSFKNNKFSDPHFVSDSTVGTFHQPRMAVVDSNNLIVVSQIWAGGARTYYNWMRDGKWSGLITHNRSKAVEANCGVDLTATGIAALGFTTGGAIEAALSGPLSINDMPVAMITVDKETIFWGETVNMNSTGSYDPDGTIVGYEWRIVQDGITVPGATASYVFNKSYNNVKIRLTAIDNKGGRGVAEKVIKVNAIYTAPSTVTKQKIQTLLYNKEGNVIEWTPNPKNEELGYTIVKYKISRKASDSTEWVELAEVGADRRSFADVTIEAGTNYAYAVSAVDDQARMSPYDNY